MGILNYSSYVHKMEIGLRRNGMHPMAVLLLNSIVTYPSVKNRWGKPYKISRTEMVREDLSAPGYARFSRDFDRQRRFYYMADPD